jgi:glycosyltransferase involved in cell wall biosynthesis
VLVSVVVPCYRSAATLPALVERLDATLATATAGFEVILVVDGSPDNTWQVAHDLAGKYPCVRAIRLARNYGQHNALIAGVRSARHEIVVTMDDDLQHPPEEVPKLLAALTDDLDLVYAQPLDEEHSFLRNLSSNLTKASLAGALGVQDAKIIGAFRVFRTFLRDGFDGLSGPHASVDVALTWATTRVGAVRVRMDERAEGRSNYTFKSLVKHALNLAMGYSVAPLRAVSYLGVGCGVLGVVLLGVILWRFATGQTGVPGFTSIASMIALFSGAQMLAIGVLGEYVGRLHSGGMGRPTYVVRERTDIDAHPEIRTDR